MRTSRDVARPLVALLVVVAAVGLVSNVAAFRAAATPDHDQVAPAGSGACADVGVATDRDGGSVGDADADADNGDRQVGCRTGDDDGDDDGSPGGPRESDEKRGVTVVTTSGAS